MPNKTSDLRELERRCYDAYRDYCLKPTNDDPKAQADERVRLWDAWCEINERIVKRLPPELRLVYCETVGELNPDDHFDISAFHRTRPEIERILCLGLDVLTCEDRGVMPPGDPLAQYNNDHTPYSPKDLAKLHEVGKKALEGRLARKRDSLQKAGFVREIKKPLVNEPKYLYVHCGVLPIIREMKLDSVAR